MPWPPIIPPATRDNTTAQQDNHPGDHNQTSQALTDTVTEIEATKARVTTNEADIDTNANEIAAHNAIYTPSGVMNLPTPAIDSDVRTSLRNADDSFIAYLAGPRSSTAVRDTSTTFADPGTWLRVSGAEVVIDLTLNNGRGMYVSGQASITPDLGPGEQLSVKWGYEIDNTGVVEISTSYQGYSRNDFGATTIYPNIMSLPATRLIEGGTTLTVFPMVYAVGGIVTMSDKRMSVTPFWQ